jgi:cardiolipin synthase A/B
VNLTAIVFVTGYCLNVLFILHILFYERGDSVKRFSWLLAIAFIPVAGAALYILFSGNFFTRTRRMMKAAAMAEKKFASILDAQGRELDLIIKSGLAPTVERYAPLLRLNMTYGRSPVYTHNSVHLFRSGAEKYRALFAELERATTSIHLSYFIIRNDHTGKELVRILEKKALEGVSVRLLYDHVGSIRTSSRLFRPLEKAGGQVSRFFPVSLFNPFSVNYRNHRKIAVIDGTTGYFGGINIGDEYANIEGARKYRWRDTHIRISGPAVKQLEVRFLADWYTARWKKDKNHIEIDDANLIVETHGSQPPSPDIPLPEKPYSAHAAIQLVSAGPDDIRNDQIRDALIHMISHAREFVYVETPYFTPDAAFYSALKIAALSGVDVRIIVPGKWDKWYVALAAMPFIDELTACGVTFSAYRGFMHAKMLVVDGDVVSIGTTNVDTRSFSLNFEQNGFFFNDEFALSCANLFREDEAESDPITHAALRATSPVKRGLWNFFRLFAPLL